jgi:phosphoglycerate dehydrogenase-like enzyme
MTRSPDRATKLVIVLHHRLELWTAPAWVAERLRNDFPQVEIVQFNSYEHIEGELRDAEIAVAWSLRPGQLKAAQKLRWIHSPAAAVHQLLFPELVNSDIMLTNAREVHGPVVAEHVMALIFALAKKLPEAVRLQQRHVWGQETMWGERPRPREVAGATLGVVGLGSIGREVARRAQAMGMRVIAVREHPERAKPEAVEKVFAVSELSSVLSESDYVVLAIPVTPATRGLLSTERIAVMKADACLINVGRGALLDEAALAHALGNHRIGGAALDVFEREPLPAESPLWDLENLLITPHTAGMTEKLWERHYVLIRENLRRYLAGEPLLAVVDKQRGY